MATITLDGVGYVLSDGIIKLTPYQEWVAMLRTTGQQERMDRQYVSQLVIADFPGGFCWTRHDPLGAKFRFNESTSETRFSRQITLPPLKTAASYTTPDATRDIYYSMAEFSGNLYMVGEQRIGGVNRRRIRTFSNATPSWNASATAESAGWPASPPSCMGNMLNSGTLVYAFGYDDGAGNLNGCTCTYNAASGTWAEATIVTEATTNYTAVTKTQVCLDPTLGNYVVVANMSANTLPAAVAINRSGALAWVANAHVPGVFNGAAILEDEDGVNSLFVCTYDGLYKMALGGTTAVPAVLKVAALPYNIHNGDGMRYWNGILYVPVGSGLRAYSFTGGAVQWADVSLSNNGAITADRKGYMTATADGAKQLFIGYGGNWVITGTHASVYSLLDNEWHYITSHATATKKIIALVVSAAPDQTERLHILTEGADAAHTLSYVTSYPEDNPLSVVQSYASSSILDTPVYDLGLGEVDTGFYKLAFVGDALTAANTTIVAKYGLNGTSPVTTTLGTFTNAVTELPFASGVGVEGRLIQFDFTLARVTATLTPNVWYFVLYYLKDPTSRRIIEFTVDLVKTAEALSRPVGDILTTLKTLRDTRTLVVLGWGGETANVKIVELPQTVTLDSEGKSALAGIRGLTAVVRAIEMP